MSNTTPLYVQRRELVDGLSSEATEDDYTEAYVRITTGDLADDRFPLWIRELGWWLLISGAPQAGITQSEATKAGHYVGVGVTFVEEHGRRGYRRSGLWRHG